jgi:hypothetical protein
VHNYLSGKISSMLGGQDDELKQMMGAMMKQIQ